MGLKNRREVELWKQRASDERNRRVELGRQLTHARDQLTQLERQIEDGVRERAVLERLLARTAEQNSLMLGRIDSLVREVIGIASRSPQVVDQSATIREIGDVLANILVGRENDGGVGAMPANTPLPPSMGDMGLGADFSPPGLVFPSVEFDPHMDDPNNWPKVGEWTATTPTIPSESMTPVHVMTPQGMRRADGSQMFQAGSTAPPPAGGVE